MAGSCWVTSVSPKAAERWVRKMSVNRTRFPFLYSYYDGHFWNKPLMSEVSPEWWQKPPTPTASHPPPITQWRSHCDRGVAFVTQPVTNWLWFHAKNHWAHSAASHIINKTKQNKIKLKSKPVLRGDAYVLFCSVAVFFLICCCFFYEGWGSGILSSRPTFATRTSI